MSTTEKPDAIALLKADHRKVEELFESFEKARGVERKQTIAKQICTELIVHTIIEEEIFYPACRGAVEDDLLDEGYVEHDGAKVLIAEILSSEPSEEFYDAKVKVLSEQIEHHVEEEEKRVEGMFSQARKAGLDMDALGEKMAMRKQQALEEFERTGLPAPETRSFTGHDLEQGAPVDDETAERSGDREGARPTS
ncbi:MAG: hemerythrin domain-containing protein [Caulobacter sp.]